MNYITNNDSYEMYISKFSFPWYFRFNALIDEDNIGNPTDPLLYFSYPIGSSGKINMLDIRYNCWGNNFSATDDLYPSTYYIYNPTACVPGGSPIETAIVEQLYIDGKSQFDSQEYSTAKTTFQLLINQYPESVYAESAMKELIDLEKFAGNDYQSLKTFYETNDIIAEDTVLNKLSTSLVNKCEINLGNYQEAIDYFEETILNPESIEDSLFAIIDLGYVYFLMENVGDKSNYTGNLIEFKPSSKEKFFAHRDYLLSLLPLDNDGSDPINDINAQNVGNLSQNTPNPFSDKTNIIVELKKSSSISIRIMDLNGKTIQNLQIEKGEGKHQISIDLTNEPAGIYYYSLFVDGVYMESNKMLLIK